jgi:hypothetical protein
MSRTLPAWVFPTAAALVTFVTIYARPYSALPQPNELSRLYLTRALAEQRSIDILPQVRLPGVSSQVATPLGDVHRPLIACGVLPHNLGHSLGLDGAVSLIPLGLALAALIALVAWLALSAGADAGSIGVAMVVAAVGVYAATRPHSAAPAERAQLVQRFAEVESKEQHRAGLGPRRCTTVR